jgi:hypothetical protein
VDSLRAELEEALRVELEEAGGKVPLSLQVRIFLSLPHTHANMHPEAIRCLRSVQ